MASLAALLSPSPAGLAVPPEALTERREVQRLLTPSAINPPELDIDSSNITSPGLTPAYKHSPKKVGSDVSDPGRTSPSRPARTVSRLRKTVSTRQKCGLTAASPKGSKKGKEKAALVTPLEYALRLQSNLLTITPKTSYLKGKCIFYVGGDMQYASTRTRGRMDYIIKHGGTLVPKYDPAIITHIVTDTGPRITLRALSLKSLSEIPDHIPTVTWSWILSGYGRATNGNRKTNDYEEEQFLGFEFMHAAFPERIDAGREWNKRTGRKDKQRQRQGARFPDVGPSNDINDELSRISDFSQEKRKEAVIGCSDVAKVLPPLPLNLLPNVGLSRVKTGQLATLITRKTVTSVPADADDPLAEYYAQAKAQHDAAWAMDESDSDDGDESFEFHGENLFLNQGFSCDQKGPQGTTCANQDIVEKLQELMKLHESKPSDHDRWRVISYGKCIRALRNYPKRITSFSEARSIRGVGEKTALKIMEIINTGDLRRIEHERTDDVEATRLFQGIYGVGEKCRSTAFAWYASGHRTLDDIRARSKSLRLSPAQEIGLKFYNDINSRMPREEAAKIFNIIKSIALEIDDSLFIEIMGSYRRGKADCGDIDVLVTRPVADGKTHAGMLVQHPKPLGVLPRLLDRLRADKILTEDLAVPADPSELELIYRGLCKLPDAGAKHRRIDILCVPWESRGAALLYYTGDDIFNRAMRLKANVMGYSLNQRGLYAGVVREPQNRRVKLSDGSIIASETEEEIFQILGE
ncbi:hypothetical protein EDD16DRAFT_1484052 [Pisolithus croceorrhizus]|nr:hypothetical protein EDD16DRAFT_1484052 [Pisolithus croceorrhizus]KAI6134256.1 hypothetical protein EV401DRAFT_1847290 [Pisolithus croceorrhizus]